MIIIKTQSTLSFSTDMSISEYLQGMGFTNKIATNITDMIGGDKDAWALLQVNPNNLQDLSPLNRQMLQKYITILQQTRDIGKTPEMVVLEKRENSEILSRIYYPE